MSKVTCRQRTIALAIVGSQLPGMCFWLLSTKADNEPCAYRWGDLNRAADRAGYQAGVALQYGDLTQAPIQPAPIPPAGNTAAISGSNRDTAAAAASEGDFSTSAPIYQAAHPRTLEENVAEIDKEVMAGTYRPADQGSY